MAMATIIERLAFKCPFCGKRAAIVDVQEGTEQAPGVVHDKPECKEFLENGPTEFMAAVIKAFRGRLN